MRTLKSGLIILVIIAFLAGAYFITTPKKQSTADKNSAGINLSSSEPKTDNLYASDEKNNLTKDLGQNLFEQIKKENETNPDFFSSLPDINAISQKIIDDSLKSNSFNLDQPINETDLKISRDNSKEAKLKYFEELNKIVLARFNDPSHKTTPSQAIENINADCYGNGSSLDKELANFYPSVVDDYLNIATPSDFLSLHKEIVAHFKNASLIYQALANCSQDLIKGYIAVQTLPDLAEKTIAIQTLLEKKYKEVNLEK